MCTMVKIERTEVQNPRRYPHRKHWAASQVSFLPCQKKGDLNMSLAVSLPASFFSDLFGLLLSSSLTLLARYTEILNEEHLHMIGTWSTTPRPVRGADPDRHIPPSFTLLSIRVLCAMRARVYGSLVPYYINNIIMALQPIQKNGDRLH